MVKTEFMYLMEELEQLYEDYVLKSHGYKVGDLVEFKNYKDDSIHGMVLDCFDGGNRLGILYLDGRGAIEDTLFNEIYRKITEKTLTDKERVEYKKHAIPLRDRRISDILSSGGGNADDEDEEMPQTAETDDWRAREAVDDEYLRDAIQMFQNDEDAKGVVVSCEKTSKTYPIRVCRLYYSDADLQKIIDLLIKKYGKLSYIHAYHDRGVIQFLKDKWEKADAQTQEDAQNEVNNLFKDKAIKEIKELGLFPKEYTVFGKLYKEYIPAKVPGDQNEQDRLLRILIKAIKQYNKDIASSNATDKKPVESSNIPKDEKSDEQKPNANTEPKNAKLNRARQNNSKIVKAFKEVGLATDDLIVVAQNKNGKDYKKASDKLNKLRKTLFGEAFEEELDDSFNQEF
jgi:ferritin-like protein